ncbi:glycosyltransferase family 29 protein [Synechococcus sp. L2F]|uniref:glycosyltransferase family 29 protein n=1 Tax=Synechococcus sp. L2F TaxID=2823739 RepID=UPI0020CF2ADB|nr:glycosyltransferase family 29 protein [Synechococcus sp. L2F]MCP9827924.1 glycosyltransferase family 29 protein [Synechococcus sp. L2F]
MPEQYSSALDCVSDAFSRADSLEQPLWEFFSIFVNHRELFYSAGDELFSPSFSGNADYLRFLSLLFSRSRRYELSIKACDFLCDIGEYVEEAVNRRTRSHMLLESMTQSNHSSAIFASLYTSKILKNDVQAFNDRHLSVIDFLQAQTSKSDEAALRQDNLKMFLDINTWLQSAKSVAIVGSGPKIIGREKGEEIDSHDRVIRINFAYDKSLVKDIGERTDLVISSNQHFTGQSNVLRSGSDLSSFTQSPCMLLDCSHVTLEPMPPSISIENSLISMPAPIRAILAEIGYKFSTTGLASILYVACLLRINTSLYGFDFYEDFSRPYFHSTMTLEPSILHEIHFERLLGRSAMEAIFENVTIRT